MKLIGKATVLVTAALVVSSFAAIARGETVDTGRPGFADYQGYPVSYFEYGPGPEQAPTVMVTGGWPGNSSGMIPFAEQLAADGFHVVRWDMHGAGKTSRDRRPGAYSMEGLAGEFGAVMDKTAGGHHVHIFGDGWGPFIGSQYNTEVPGRIASISSIGFPSADLAGNALRRVPQEKPEMTGQWALQLAALSYLVGIEIPLLPDAAVRTGIPVQVLMAMAKVMAPDLPGGSGPQDPEEDADGLERYRQAMWPHLTQPRYDYIDIPRLQVFYATDDFLETPVLIEGLETRTPHLDLRYLPGNHYSVFSGDNARQILTATEETIRATD
ncbi:alpha/beta fold hydrolase [Nocardia transvalensis]|uniref:alpha/beta fold hydrolase n=1 Tax=Nocardia transvalensis TaxID=37333 RepID=UPI001E4EACFC|nr:alpha/beta fold hydrolase [Nocardia transvalensis]MBF6327966.1 alpha/beta fold hydrolase [Nocardia transvalensis]